MKRINLLPQSSWWERYWWLLILSVSLIAGISLGLYLLWYYVGSAVLPMPATTVLTSSTTQNAQHSAYKLKMVGYLNQGEDLNAQTLSLLAFPDGQIVTVKVDDVVGAEAAKVIEINPTNTVVCLPDTKALLTIYSATHD